MGYREKKRDEEEGRTVNPSNKRIMIGRCITNGLEGKEEKGRRGGQDSTSK